MNFVEDTKDKVFLPNVGFQRHSSSVNSYFKHEHERPHSPSHSRQIYMFRFRSSETPETCQETSPEQMTSIQSYTANILELSFSILQIVMFLER